MIILMLAILNQTRPRLVVQNMDGSYYYVVVKQPMAFAPPGNVKPENDPKAPGAELFNALIKDPTVKLVTDRPYTFRGKRISVFVTFYPRNIIYAKKYDHNALMLSIREEFAWHLMDKILKKYPARAVSGHNDYWSTYKAYLYHGILFGAKNKGWLISVLCHGTSITSPSDEKNILAFALSIRPTPGDMAYITKEVTQAAALPESNGN